MVKMLIAVHIVAISKASTPLSRRFHRGIPMTDSTKKHHLPSCIDVSYCFANLELVRKA